jgi:hypothetical protein
VRRQKQPSDTVPPFPALAGEQVCRVAADAVTGSQIPNLIAPPKGRNGLGRSRTRSGSVIQCRRRTAEPAALQAAAAAAGQRSHGAGPFACPADFDTTRALVNERLLSGFQLLADGRIQRASPAVTFAEAPQCADDLRAELT